MIYSCISTLVNYAIYIHSVDNNFVNTRLCVLLMQFVTYIKYSENCIYTICAEIEYGTVRNIV